MWTAAQVQRYADEVKAFIIKADQVVSYLAKDQTAVAIEQHLPHGAAIIEAFGGADRVLGFAVKGLPYVGEAFAFYEAYKAAGGRPMDANDIARLNYEKTKVMG